MVEHTAGYNELEFLTFLINFVVDKSPGDLLINFSDLSEHMVKMEHKCDENLYRKQYGNMKECVEAGKAIMAVF